MQNETILIIIGIHLCQAFQVGSYMLIAFTALLNHGMDTGLMQRKILLDPYANVVAVPESYQSLCC